MENKASGPAARMRRLRARRAMGVRVVPVEVHGDIVRELIERGRLTMDDRRNPEAIARALEEVIDDAI